MLNIGREKKYSRSMGFFILALIACVLLLFMPLETVSADPLINRNPETGYVMLIDDMAGLLNQSEEEALLEAMEEITQFGHAGFVSIDAHGYSDHMDFADAYFKANFGTESGTLLVIDMQFRKITLFNDGAIEKTVTKSYANTITDNIYSYASNGDYFTCAENAFIQVSKLLNGQRIAQPMKYASNFFLALILVLLINYLRARLVSASYKASDKEWIEKLSIRYEFTNLRTKLYSTVRKYSPRNDSDSGGGSRSGGGGGGSSGSGGSHSF